MFNNHRELRRRVSRVFTWLSAHGSIAVNTAAYYTEQARGLIRNANYHNIDENTMTVLAWLTKRTIRLVSTRETSQTGTRFAHVEEFHPHNAGDLGLPVDAYRYGAHGVITLALRAAAPPHYDFVQFDEKGDCSDEEWENNDESGGFIDEDEED